MPRVIGSILVLVAIAMSAATVHAVTVSGTINTDLRKTTNSAYHKTETITVPARGMLAIDSARLNTSVLNSEDSGKNANLTPRTINPDEFAIYKKQWKLHTTVNMSIVDWFDTRSAAVEVW